MSTRTSTRRAVPLAVGTRRTSGQRYAATTEPTMRNVAQRATVAVVGVTLALAAMIGATSGPSIADQCADIIAGTDAVPADVLTICQH